MELDQCHRCERSCMPLRSWKATIFLANLEDVHVVPMPLPEHGGSTEDMCFTGPMQVQWIGQLLKRPQQFVLHADCKHKREHKLEAASGGCSLTLGTHYLQYSGKVLAAWALKCRHFRQPRPHGSPGDGESSGVTRGPRRTMVTPKHAFAKGKNSMAKVMAFLNLIDGASNKAIGDLGEAIAIDILILLGAAHAVKHPTPVARGVKARSECQSGANVEVGFAIVELDSPSSNLTR